MKRILKRLIILFSFVIGFRFFAPGVSYATSKTGLANKNCIIPIGKQTDFAIQTNNKVKDAKYTYTTSDKNIVTVNSLGIPTGIKAGTAQITVKQTLNNKTATIGTCAVTVKNPNINNKVSKCLILGNYGLYIGKPESLNTWGLICYQNSQATYTYYSNDSNLLILKKNGTIVETKKPGKVTVTIKESFKNKVKTVGTCTLKIQSPKMKDTEMLLNIGETYDIRNSYKDYTGPIYISIKSTESNGGMCISPVKDKNGKWTYEVKGDNKGTASVSVYMGNENNANKLIGSIDFEVK